MRVASELKRTVAFAARPYIWRELPAWGKVYRKLVGDEQHDADWSGLAPLWLRGKFHGFEMLLDLSGWSNRRTYFLGRFYDLPTQLVVKALLQPGDTFIDIGANEGMISLVAARAVGPQGRVLSYEPNPKPRSRIEAAIERNAITNIQVRPVGLSAENAVLTLTIPRVNSGEGSFGKPNYAPDQLVSIDCPVLRADDELAEVTPALVKIDVEGFEPYVIEGMTQTIERGRFPIVMEIVTAHLQNAGSSVEALVTQMEKLGYRGFHMKPVRIGLKHGLSMRRVTPKTGFIGDVLWLHESQAVPPTLAQAVIGPDR